MERTTTRDVSADLIYPREDTVKFEDGFVIEGNGVDFSVSHVGFRQAVADGLNRESLVMLDSCESLFLCCRNNLAVFYDARCSIVVKAADTDNSHSRTGFRVTSSPR